MTKKLKAKAVRVFHAYIRQRDEGKPCISCGRYRKLQAGHFYSAGHYPALRFNPNNVHGQCVRCNKFLSGNLNEYRKHLIDRIGIKEVEKLDTTAGYWKRNNFKWDRFYLENVIKEYGS